MYSLRFVFFLNFTIFCSVGFSQRWITYSTPQGVAGAEVRDILVDQNGEIWLATNNGVNRFNGEWLIYGTEEGLVHQQVTSIVQDMDAMIWFGTKGGISKIDPKTDLNNLANWTSYTVANTGGGLSNDYITSIVIDTDSTIWFATNGGGISVVDRTPVATDPSKDPLLDPGKWMTFTENDGLSSNVILHGGTADPSGQRMIEDSIGNIWAATSKSINIFEFENEIWRSFSLQSLIDDRDVRAIFADHDGNIWIGVKSNGLYKTYPNNLSTFDEHYTVTNTRGLSSNNIVAIAQDKAGMMWFGHADGVSMVPADSDLADTTNWNQFTTLDGLASNSISAVSEDEEENVWFGHSEASGVSQLDRSWHSFLVQRDVSTEVFFKDNQRSLWIQTKDRPDARFPGVVRVRLDANLMLNKNLSDVFTDSSGLSSIPVFAVFQDSRNNFWFGSDDGVNRVAEERIDDVNQWEAFDTSRGLVSNRVGWITEDKFGYLWFATVSDGVNRVHIDSTDNIDRWQLITEESGLISNSVCEILQGQNSKLWFATNKGLSLFDPALDPKDPANWKNYNTEDGLIHDFVQSIFEDMEANIWFATKGGVSKIDPMDDLSVPSNWTNYTRENTQNGLAENFVTSITQFKADEFWFGTRVGASKFERKTNRWTHYTTSNTSAGLRANHINSLFTDRVRKEIWLGTIGGGVTRYKPKTKPPTTILENNLDIVTQNQVTFKFRGADIITPEEELRFFYKLDNDDLLETSDNSATLFVPDSDRPERHVFQVMAIDRDGNIDPTPATDVFYKIDSRLGGNVKFTDAEQNIRLFVPPGVLTEGQSITFNPIESSVLLDSLVIVAFNIEPKNFVLKENRPATLAISFLDNMSYNHDRLAIFRRTNSVDWEPLGGKVRTNADTVTVTTAIVKFGTYAVRKDKVQMLQSPKDAMNIQPRIFSPAGGGRGFGERASISFQLEKEANVTIKIYNLAGRLKRVLMKNEMYPPGINVAEWDGKDDDNNICLSGLHIVMLNAEGKILNKTVMVVNKY